VWKDVVIEWVLGRGGEGEFLPSLWAGLEYRKEHDGLIEVHHPLIQTIKCLAELIELFGFHRIPVEGEKGGRKGGGIITIITDGK